jgi:hypothetical protein
MEIDQRSCVSKVQATLPFSWPRAVLGRLFQFCRILSRELAPISYHLEAWGVKINMTFLSSNPRYSKDKYTGLGMQIFVKYVVQV